MSDAIGVFYGPFQVGVIDAGDGGPRFRYDGRWLATRNAFPLSLRMPLSEAEIGAEVLLPWLANLLPEEQNLLQIGRNLGIAPQDVLGLLQRIGRDTAGALSIGRPEDDNLPSTRGVTGESEYRIVDNEGDLERIIGELPAKPFLAGEEGVAMSLAGGQDKLPVALVDGRIAIPLHGAPSTHILKPDNPRLWGSVANEVLCLKLAARVGLNVASATTGRAGARSYLLVTRYDRVRNDGRWVRLHQEDFCQALGRFPQSKYERNQSGARGPSLAEMVDVIRRHLLPTDMLALLDGAIFNVLIGNVDSHAKNYSILWRGSTPAFAPLYDLMCGAVWPHVTRNLPQTIGGQTRGDYVTARHWRRLAHEAGLGPAQLLRRVRELADHVPAELPAALDAVRAIPVGDHPSLDVVAREIGARCRRVLVNLAAGADEAAAAVDDVERAVDR